MQRKQEDRRKIEVKGHPLTESDISADGDGAFFRTVRVERFGIKFVHASKHRVSHQEDKEVGNVIAEA